MFCVSIAPGVTRWILKTLFVNSLCLLVPCSWEVWQLKDAVFKFLTLLKHNNTIICLQIFQKHVKLTSLFIWKTMLQKSLSRLKGLERGGGTNIMGQLQNSKSIIICARSCWCPQSSNLRVRQVWGKNPLQYFEFGLQYCQTYIQHL